MGRNFADKDKDLDSLLGGDKGGTSSKSDDKSESGLGDLGGDSSSDSTDNSDDGKSNLKYKLEPLKEPLIYESTFLTSELKPVQDIYVGRALINATSTGWSKESERKPGELNSEVIVSDDLSILDGHHFWAGAFIAGIEKLNGLKVRLNFNAGRRILLILSKKYGRDASLNNSNDILLSSFRCNAKDLSYILNNVIPDDYKDAVNNLVETTDVIGKLQVLKTKVPVIGYLKEKMPTFIRSKGDYDRLVEDFRKIKVEDVDKSDNEIAWNPEAAGSTGGSLGSLGGSGDMGSSGLGGL